MKMQAKQKAIYEGLKSIGKEVSSLYADAILIKQTDGIVSKSYLIAHIAREIDAGLRDVLAPKEAQQEKREVTKHKDKNHLVSILTALDLPDDDLFAKEYFGVAKKFPKYAHKKGAYGEPRKLTEFLSLWNDYEDILLKLIGSFINQLKRIERLVQYEVPSKQILLTLPNLFNDLQKERHFYTQLKKVSWFEPLYKNGFFSPITIREDQFWNQTEYLEYLSIEVNNKTLPKEFGKVLVNLVDEILTYSITVAYIYNYRIRYTLLLILTNIPKEYISDRIMSLIPHCLHTKYENILESNQIFQFYYSFFRGPDVPNTKGLLNKLTKTIFSITDEEHFRDTSSYESGKYFSLIRAYRLKEACDNPLFSQAIAAHCSNDTILYIADNLEKYLKASPDYSATSVFGSKDFNDYAYSIKTNFSIILKNTLVEMGKTSPERLIDILKTLLSERYKNNHQIISITLYVISKTWNSTKNIFFDYLSNQDENKLFSTYLVSDDLYFFLEEIAELLVKEDVSIIQDIIDAGSQEDSFFNDGGQYYNDFRLKWYSALSKNEFIKTAYKRLATEQSKTKEDFHPKRNEYVTWGSISPLTKKEIEEMSIESLINYLKSFDPERAFRSASVDGLEGSFEKAIKEKPSIFMDNTIKFLEVPYRYISRIFYALLDLHREKQEINWDSIILFIKKYTSQPNFGTDKLSLKNASFPYDPTQLITSMCRLLDEGLRNDTTPLSGDSLSDILKILVRFTNQYVTNELPEKHQNELGSANQVVNSTTGVIISSLLNYSLKNAKVTHNKSTPNKWSNEEKKIYDSFLKREVQEFFVIFGWHLGNFFYLDKEWSKQLLSAIPSMNVQTRMSYFGGHIINPNSSRFEYNILKPIYEEAIINNWKIVDSTMGNSPFETHLLIFYLFNYENLEDGSLLVRSLENKSLETIRGLVHSLSFRFEKYYLDLDVKEKERFRCKTKRLWAYILNILENNKESLYRESSSNDFGVLLYLSKYITILDEVTTDLLIRSSQFTTQGINIEIIIETLNRLKEKGNKDKSLNHASRIFEVLILKDVRYASTLEDEITDFVETLYKSRLPDLINRANFLCNEFAINGQFTLRKLYEKHNP